jgi:hypothetical protein
MGPTTRAVIQRIDRLVAQYAELPEDGDVRSHWARYVCVVISGLLETAVEEMCSDYAGARSKRTVAQFVAKSVSWNNQASVDVICKTLGKFRGEWHEKAHALLEEQERTAIDSVVSLRHGIAHGRNNNVQWVVLTTEYYPSIKRAIKKLSEGLEREFA